LTHNEFFKPPVIFVVMRFSMKLLTLLIILLPINFASKADDRLPHALGKADSLFNTRKYTESFKIYEHILNAEKQASPAMLLRMSFIKEGLGNHTEALYYLNLYYLQTADKKVLTKMEELAEKKGLYGYNFSDWEFLQTVFYKYFHYLILTLLALAILLTSLMIYQKFKLKQKPLFTGISLIIVLSILFYTLNFGKNYNKSLINENNTYVMSGPSAGAEVLAIVKKGHRVEVGKTKDVWAKVDWKGQQAYIKNDKLKPISF